MNNRKKIAVFVISPEILAQQRTMEGIFIQCERYNYDVLTFSSLKDLWFSQRDYVNAELNTFNLANFDLIDGIVVMSLSMRRGNDISVIDRLADTLRAKFKGKPVVFIDFPYELEGSCTVYTKDYPAFRMITSHLLDVHNVPADKIYFLAAQKGLEISDSRITGFKQELEARGLGWDESRIFYGDFWYGSGRQLADRIISGELEMPRAIICANDQMAIGLTNQLVANGIKVPDQIIIMGYDASQDAVLNSTPITSYEPNLAGASEEAINIIRSQIEPDKPLIAADPLTEKNLCIGSSCGCQINIDYMRMNFKSALYRSFHDNTKGFVADNTDVSTIIESYMLEKMTETQTPAECISEIFNHTYLLSPFRHFYLCLRSDWLNTYKALSEGYPSTMREVIHAVPRNAETDGIEPFHSESNEHDFPTELMLPQLDLPRDKPGVFHFAPVHFQGDTLGYCVLHCDLESRVTLSAVFRNWVRNINNGLEIVRVQNRLLSYSLYDSMTGLYNRRGMDRAFSHLCRFASENDSCLVSVIDMNWLKKINDNYGHPEGDYAIQLLARCVAELASDEHSFAVRAGGDEFFVIAMGRYDEDSCRQNIEKLLNSVERSNAASGKPYSVSASIGCCLKPFTPGIKLEDLIHEADTNMYHYKHIVKETQTFEHGLK